MAWLTTELDNVRVALDGRSRGERRLRSSWPEALGWYWWHAGRAAEGHRWLDRVLASGISTDLRMRARAVTWAAWVGLEAGELTRRARTPPTPSSSANRWAIRHGSAWRGR